MNNENVGYIQEYPCTCHDSGICYIVRHPKLTPPVSFDTKEEAEEELKRLVSEVDK